MTAASEKRALCRWSIEMRRDWTEDPSAYLELKPERTFGEFDPAWLRVLAELVHGHQPAEA